MDNIELIYKNNSASFLADPDGTSMNFDLFKKALREYKESLPVDCRVSQKVGGRIGNKYDELAREIAKLINRESLEGESNTPDFILAEYLVQCLKLFNSTSNKRVRWQNQGHVTTDDSQLSG